MKWKWCLEDDTGNLCLGWFQVGDYWYYFYSNGVMACDEWVNINQEWYRVDEQGHMITGWYQDYNGYWYYLEEQSNGNKGLMYMSTTANINGTSYTFDGEGHWTKLISDNLVSFVKGYEKFYADPYNDGTNTITQGYGATGKEIEIWQGKTITEQQASDELDQSLINLYGIPIKNDLDSKNCNLSQIQFDSLVSFAYNCGVNSLLNSTLYKYIISGGRDKDTITTYFRMWNKVNGEVWEGLDKRRIAEANIFNSGVYDSSH